MSEDLLERLRAELLRHEEIACVTQQSIRELRIAIAAIEDARDVPTTPRAREEAKTSGRRGFLKRALLDSLRDQGRNRDALARDLERRGVRTSSGSISNALYRAQQAGDVRWDQKRGVYALRNEYEEGPDTEVTRPLQSNGAAVRAA
jgi:hypothetical protein